MKLIVIKDNLKEAVGAAGGMKGSDQNLPILKNFLLSAEDNIIYIRSTNLEIGIEFLISGKIIEEGSVTIPISIFHTIINSLQSDRINIETKGSQTTIKTDNYEFPSSVAAYRSMVSIPLFASMTRNQQDHVIKSIKEVVKELGL